jgi:photosystem II stability/assembly factor-like uncharacterized protein
MRSTENPFFRIAFVVIVIVFGIVSSHASDLGSGGSALRWRNIGPFRGGRTRAIAGVPSQPNLYYMAPVNGGVFKTSDYGRTWQPVFDDQPTASIGAIAVAASDPNIIYVGSGEGLHRPDLSVGDGIYKSIDAGKTWTHLGLRDGQQIAQLAVDSKNPDRLFVAVAGHPYGPNEERGLFRSLDGGKTFEKALYRDENTGASDVAIDPQNPTIVYAALWESREGPWENGVFNGDNGGIFKSIDGGETWKQLTKGLPNNIVQANIAVDPSSPNTLFAAVRTKTISKLYRSDDGGESGPGQLTIRARALALAAAICRSFGSIRKIRRSFTRPAWSAGSRSMAARHGTVGAARRAATIIKISGSIPITPMSSFSVRTREQL